MWLQNQPKINTLCENSIDCATPYWQKPLKMGKIWERNIEKCAESCHGCLKIPIMVIKINTIPNSVQNIEFLKIEALSSEKSREKLYHYIKSQSSLYSIQYFHLVWLPHCNIHVFFEAVTFLHEDDVLYCSVNLTLWIYRTCMSLSCTDRVLWQSHCGISIHLPSYQSVITDMSCIGACAKIWHVYAAAMW